MTETQRRIRAYKNALPELRERVIAVALLLAMSTSMLSSASFAWLTISRRPEVTAVSTTIAANGSLEVALATGNGKVAPGESRVGDSTAAEGQSVTGANVTWGNLINLSDESYGLEHMVMRPAQLNRMDLLGSPLYGAAYSTDGRIIKLESDFGYTAWTVDENVGGRFMTTDQMGVRAISSMKADSSAAENKVATAFKSVKDANLKAATTYQNLASNSGYMQSLATMMGLFMTARMNPDNASLSNPDCSVEDIRNLRDMYAGFLSAFDEEVQAMVLLCNVTLSMKHGENGYQPVTAEKILSSSTTSASLQKEGIQISNLTQFQRDRTTIATDMETLSAICDTSANTVKWSDSGLVDIVNHLVNVGTCTIGTNPPTPINNIGVSNAMGYLSGTQEARITNGILYRFEERTGGYLEVKGLSISAKVNRMGMTIPATVKANIQTTAPRDYNTFNNDYLAAQTNVDGGSLAVDMVAQDTYGLAVDLWVRTNSDNSYLTLEGNVVTKSEIIRATGKNADNETVELYTLKTEMTDEATGETQTFSVDIYWGTYTVINEETGESTTEEGYLYLDSHTPVTVGENDEVQEKMEEVVTIIGYEGENRIWNDDSYSTMLSTDATTQGSGSCYVYYADTPEDQARSLKLLEAFNVAFVDKNGKLLGSAIMDTKNAYAAVGRVTVPLVMNPSDSIALPQDAAGNLEYAITMLERNEPTLITAIVYLDGTKLTNQDVLAASDIQGQLNIQFGSTTPMVPMEDDNLFYQTVDVTATVSPNEFNWDEADGPLTATVTVTVTGYEPKSVTGFFMRQLSATQGSREEPMVLTKQSDGTWTGTHTFTAPGNYVLRTVRLDGIDYDVGQEVKILDEFGNPVLDETGKEQVKVEYPGSTVNGFTVTSLTCTEANENRVINVMDAASEKTVHLNLAFASNDPDKMPKTVQARFLDKEGANVNVDFVYDTRTGWNGTGTFRISGEYTLQHLVLDGETMPLDENLWITASIALGMRAAVYTDDEPRFTYLPGSVLANGKNWDDVYGELDMSVMIYDGGGKEKPGLHNVSLTYISGSREMYTNLEWNGTYYVGKMDNGGPGIWKFSKVQIGETNTITQAINAPQFTIISPEPPRYMGNSTASYQFALGTNQNLTMNVRLAYASTADNAVATIVNKKTGASYVVPFSARSAAGEDGQETNYRFIVPADTNGYQDGTWQLTKVELWGGVYDKDSTEYRDDYRWSYDLTGTNNITKIVNRVTPTFAQGQSKSFGGTSLENATAAFMTSHTVNKGEFTVEIKDLENNPVDGISDMKLEFVYKEGTSVTHGGYNSASLTSAADGTRITIPMAQVKDSNGNLTTTYTTTEDATFLYAGEYETTFSFTVQTSTGKEIIKYPDPNKNRVALANTPEVEVWSKVPTLTISSINTNASTDRYYLSSTPNSVNVMTGSYNWKSDDGYQAAVYMYVAAQGGTLDQECVAIKYPTVTLSLKDMPTTHSGATAVIGNASDSTVQHTFSFAAGATTASTTVGAGTNGVYNEGLFGIGAKVDKYPVFKPAGKQTISQIKVTHGGVEYTVTLPHAVTINNPQCPPYVTFKNISSIDSTYTGSTPANVYSKDGETITLTLPTINSWTHEASSSVDGEYIATGNNPTASVYTSKKGTIRYTHTQYTQTKTEYKATSSTTTWNETKQITGWKIGSTTYKPGDKVTVTGNQTITAVISKTQGPKTTKTTTATKYYVTFAATGSTKQNFSSTYSSYGTQVTSVTAYWTDPTYS